MKLLCLLLIPVLFAFNIKNEKTIQISNSSFDEANRIRITKTILDNLVKEDYESVRKDFHSSLKTNLPVEKISEVWKGVVSSIGAYKEIISTRTDVMQGYNQVKLRCKFESDNATLEATFTEDDKVIGLFIKP